MATAGLINPNPTVYHVSEIIRRDLQDLTDGEFDDFDSLEIFGTSLPVLSTPLFYYFYGTLSYIDARSVSKERQLTPKFDREIHVQTSSEKSMILSTLSLWNSSTSQNTNSSR